MRDGRRAAAPSSAPTPPAYSVALQVNEGYYDLFCNWLHHFRALGTSNDVWALVYGNGTYEAAVRQLHHCDEGGTRQGWAAT